MTTLTPKEHNQYIIIREYIEGKITRKQAALKLDITQSWVSILKKRCIKGGKDSFVHQNKGKINILRISNMIEAKVVELYLTKYYGFNFTHFYEQIIENGELIEVSRMNPPPSYRTVFRILVRNGIKSPKRYRDRDKTAHPKRPRRKYFGEMVQMDGSVHDWFENGKKCTLHLAVDDATSAVVGAHFEKEETTHAYFVLCKQLFENYGLPSIFYADNRSSFEYKSGKTEENRKIQFKRVCHNLGIELITTSIPEAKGRVERANRTFQDRLISEFRLHNIKDIDSANTYLEKFVQAYNKKFSVGASQSCFRENTKNLEDVLSFRETRNVLKGNVISYKNVQYRAVGTILPERTQVEILITLGKKMKIEYQGEIYEAEAIAYGSYKGQRMSNNNPWKYGHGGVIIY